MNKKREVLIRQLFREIIKESLKGYVKLGDVIKILEKEYKNIPFYIVDDLNKLEDK